METSTDRTRRGYAAFAAGDLDALRDLFHPDVTWTVPGRSSIAGTYRGVDAVLGYFVDMFMRSGGTFRAELLECGEIAPGQVAALARITGQMSGGAIDSRSITVFREDAQGRTIEATTYNEDQYALDEADGDSLVARTRAAYASFAAGDLDAVREALHPDITWHVPGRHALAGSYRGVEAVMGYFIALFERSSGTFAAELLRCGTVAPDTAHGEVRITGDLPGGALDATVVQTFREVDGKVIEVRTYAEDQDVIDAAMGAATISLPDARTPAQPIIAT